MYIVTIFYHSMPCLFIFLNKAIVFNFVEAQYEFSILGAFKSFLKSLCLLKDHEDILLFFLLEA